MIRRLLLALSLLLATPALAQVGGGTPVYQNWYVTGNSPAVSVSNVSAAHLYPSTGPTARICNQGTVDAYLNPYGLDNSVTATTNGLWLKAGTCQVYNLKPSNAQYLYFAAITSASTTTLYVETGLGAPTQASLNSGGGGSSITWPSSGSVVVSNVTNSPAGIAEVDGNCMLGVSGAWTSAACPNSGGTVTVFGSITPSDCVQFYGTNVIQDAGIPCGGSGSGITQLTGDVIAGPGSGAQGATLASVNANVGTFGSSVRCPNYIVNAKGLITASGDNNCPSVNQTQYALMIGGGTNAAPTTVGSLGTTTTVLHGNASGAPSYGAVNLSTDITGSLALTSLATQVADSVVMNASGSSAAPTAVALPGSCTAANQADQYNTTSHAWSCVTITGSGSPGGASGTLQYNNGGVFGGITNTATNGTSLLELGATTAPVKTLTLASAATGIAAYNTSDQTTNTEYGLLDWETNVWTMKTAKAGTGSSRSITISAAGTLTLASTASMPIVIAGSTAATVNSNAFTGSASNAAWVGLNYASGATTPTLVPNQASTATGIGGTTGNLSLIAGSVEVVHISSIGATFNKDILTSGTTPTVTTCGGGSPTIAAGSTDTAGKVTEGTGSISCTVTFASVKANAPFCTASYGSGAGGTLAVSTSTTGVSIQTGSAVASQTWFYICVQH